METVAGDAARCKMTKTQAPMTNQTANSNDQWRAGDWALPFRLRFIGHWCLGIGHFLVNDG